MTTELKTTADILDAIFGTGTCERTMTPDELAEARTPQTYTAPAPCHHVKLKVTGSGQASLTHPQAALGVANGARTIMITNVPPDVSAAEVLRRYNATVDAGHDHAYSYSELGRGRIVR